MRLQSRLSKIEGQLQGLQAQDVSWIIPLLPDILGQEPPEKLTEALWLMSSGMAPIEGWKWLYSQGQPEDTLLLSCLWLDQLSSRMPLENLRASVASQRAIIQARRDQAEETMALFESEL